MADNLTRGLARRAAIAAGVAGVHGALLLTAATLGTGPAPTSRPPLVIELVSLPPTELESEPEVTPEPAPDPQPSPDRPVADAPAGDRVASPEITSPEADLPSDGPAARAFPAPASGTPQPTADETPPPPLSLEGVTALRAILCAKSGPNRPDDCDDTSGALLAAGGVPDRFDPAEPGLAPATFAAFEEPPGRAPAAARYPGQTACASAESGMLPNAAQQENRAFMPNAAQGGAVLTAEPDRVWCD